MGRIHRTFIHTGKAYYGPSAIKQRTDDLVDEIVIQVLEDDFLVGEFSIEWHKNSHPRIQVFNDAWAALNECVDLIDHLSLYDGEDVSPAKMCDILNGRDFLDATPLTTEKADVTSSLA